MKTLAKVFTLDYKFKVGIKFEVSIECTVTKIVNDFFQIVIGSKTYIEKVIGNEICIQSKKGYYIISL